MPRQAEAGQKMAVEADATIWAAQVFGRCNLGDARRTARLVKTVAGLAVNRGGSVAQAHKWDAAGQEGGYRLLRNPRVSVAAMDEAAFQSTVQRVQSTARLLAIDDSTSLSYAHSVADELGYTTSQPTSKSKGLFVHSTLLIDAESEMTEGLIAQYRWSRKAVHYGKKHQRTKTRYEQKESYKWTRNARAMRERLADKMADVVAVCDRESDIFDYLHDKLMHGERFIVRAAQDRQLLEADARLFAAVASASKCGEMSVAIAQRGERKARVAQISLRAECVELPAPRRSECHGDKATITVNIVLAKEDTSTADDEPLCWYLLTTEAIASADQLRDIVRCYGLRWRIEDFHKAWKSGAKVEAMRMQSRDALERMIVMLAQVAIRMLQLRETLNNETAAKRPCTDVLNDLEWKILWASDMKTPNALPGQVPTLRWAYEAIARLGGFYDSKRTGRASWEAVYRGWQLLNDRVQSYRIMVTLAGAVS